MDFTQRIKNNQNFSVKYLRKNSQNLFGYELPYILRHLRTGSHFSEYLKIVHKMRYSEK